MFNASDLLGSQYSKISVPKALSLKTSQCTCTHELNFVAKCHIDSTMTRAGTFWPSIISTLDCEQTNFRCLSTDYAFQYLDFKTIIKCPANCWSINNRGANTICKAEVIRCNLIES